MFFCTQNHFLSDFVQYFLKNVFVRLHGAMLTLTQLAIAFVSTLALSTAAPTAVHLQATGNSGFEWQILK